MKSTPDYKTGYAGGTLDLVGSDVKLELDWNTLHQGYSSKLTEGKWNVSDLN